MCVPRDPGSPASENGSMEPKIRPAFRFGDWPPQSSTDKVIGSLGCVIVCMCCFFVGGCILLNKKQFFLCVFCVLFFFRHKNSVGL